MGMSLIGASRSTKEIPDERTDPARRKHVPATNYLGEILSHLKIFLAGPKNCFDNSDRVFRLAPFRMGS